MTPKRLGPSSRTLMAVPEHEPTGKEPSHSNNNSPCSAETGLNAPVRLMLVIAE